MSAGVIGVIVGGTIALLAGAALGWSAGFDDGWDGALDSAKKMVEGCDDNAFLTFGVMLMTKQEAISELTRAAKICPTTPLAEACRMAVDVLSATTDDKSPHDCINCRHKDRTPGVYPCSQCEQRYSDLPTMWEPKEVDNGQND